MLNLDIWPSLREILYYQRNADKKISIKSQTFRLLSISHLFIRFTINSQLLNESIQNEIHFGFHRFLCFDREFIPI